MGTFLAAHTFVYISHHDDVTVILCTAAEIYSKLYSLTDLNIVEWRNLSDIFSGKLEDRSKKCLRAYLRVPVIPACAADKKLLMNRLLSI